MKRCRFGAGLLLALLLLGVVSGRYLSRLAAALSEQVEQAAFLMEESPAAGKQMLTAARETWQRRRLLMCILSDHEPVTEADTLFALLADDPQAENFRENALRLSRMLSDLGESQLPKPENIF